MFVSVRELTDIFALKLPVADCTDFKYYYSNYINQLIRGRQYYTLNAAVYQRIPWDLLIGIEFPSLKNLLIGIRSLCLLP